MLQDDGDRIGIWTACGFLIPKLCTDIGEDNAGALGRLCSMCVCQHALGLQPLKTKMWDTQCEIFCSKLEKCGYYFEVVQEQIIKFVHTKN